MQRLVLIKPVVLNGHDIFGNPAWLKLERIEHSDDWVWGLPDGTDIWIVPSIFEARLWRVALVYCRENTGAPTYVFNDFPDLGLLRAGGLRGGVRVSVGPNGWPPYDPSGLWDSVLRACVQDGYLEPYRTQLTVGIDPTDKRRRIHYSPDKRDDRLHLTGHINYFGFGGWGFDFSHDGLIHNLRRLANARKLVWPPIARRPLQLAAMLGLWPHERLVNWPGDRDDHEVLEEACRCRMRALLGTLNFAAPAGHYLAGWINSQEGGPRADVELLRSLGMLRPNSTAPILETEAA